MSKKYSNIELINIKKMIDEITDKSALKKVLEICMNDEKNVRYDKHSDGTCLDLVSMSPKSLTELYTYLENYHKNKKNERKDLVHVPLQQDESGLIDTKLNNVEKRLIKNRNAQRKTNGELSELDMSKMSSSSSKNSKENKGKSKKKILK